MHRTSTKNAFQSERAALSKAAHLVFEIREQTRQQELRDIFFSPTTLRDLDMQISQGLYPVSIHPFDDSEKQGPCIALLWYVKASRRARFWASCHALMRDII